MKKEQDSETNSFCYLKWVFGPGVEKMMQIGGTKSPIFKIFFFSRTKKCKRKKVWVCWLKCWEKLEMYFNHKSHVWVFLHNLLRRKLRSEIAWFFRKILLCFVSGQRKQWRTVLEWYYFRKSIRNLNLTNLAMSKCW